MYLIRRWIGRDSGTERQTRAVMRAFVQTLARLDALARDCADPDRGGLDPEEGRR